MAPTGAQQLGWDQPPAEVAVAILADYYGTHPPAPAIGLEGDEPADRDLLPDRSSVMARLFEASERHPQAVAT